MLPTLLDLAGLDHPGVRHGLPAKSIDGLSVRARAATTADAPSTHPEQYAEFGGNRGFYRDGWKIVTNHRPGTPFDDGEWELYDVAQRPQRAPRPVAAHEPGAAQGAGGRRGSGRPGRTPCSRCAALGCCRRSAARPSAELERPLRLLPGTPKLERYRSSQLVNLRSFAVDIDVDHAAGDQGVLVAHGDQGGGYLLYVEDGGSTSPTTSTAGSTSVDGGPAGARARAAIRLERRWRPGSAGSSRLCVDGAEVGGLDSVAMLVGMAPFSGIDVGHQPRRPGPLGRCTSATARSPTPARSAP